MSSVAQSIKSVSPPHLEVMGGNSLSGCLKVSGAKNSVLVLMAASILSKETVHIENVPNLTDINTLSEILLRLGARIKRSPNKIAINSSSLCNRELPQELVNSLRASFFCIGPIISRLGKATIPLPGGCQIGARPLDEHINGLRALGANVEIKNKLVIASIPNKKKRLKGTKISLHFPSVGATETILMAASLAEGKTIINRAAKEPEIKDLANMLNRMGARISGAGTSKITIEGVKSLGGVTHSAIPDRIEAGTFLIAAAITRSPLLVGPIIQEHLQAVIVKLKECGCKIQSKGNYISIIPGHIKGVDITTSPFPGFPTDLQAPFMALMATAKGSSKITEKIYEGRMQHVSQLEKMGASIKLKNNIAIINGVKELKGSYILGGDLRSSAAMVLASIAAKGISKISGLNHLDRGYETLEKKLNKTGTNIVRHEEIVTFTKTLTKELGTEDNLDSQKKAA